MKSVMEHSFAKVPQVDIQRSMFDRSHGHKTTFDAGKLIPILVDDALPGDSFNLEMSAFIRMLSALDRPIMDNLILESFFFSVPNRLLWSNWKRFMGERNNPADGNDFTVPVINETGGGFAAGTNYDHMGIPPGVNNITINALPFRALYRIYNEWFRDQNLQDSKTVGELDGPDTGSWYNDLLTRGKRHDYFTSCLPWPLKGPEVPLPLGTEAPVVTNDETIRFKQMNTSSPSWDVQMQGSTNPAQLILNHNNTGGSVGMEFGDETGLKADLSAASAPTINSLREAFQLQRLYERDARSGTRYIEVIKAHFNVTSPDMRQQRPEYLGGGKSYINVHPVANQSGSTGNVGELGAFGTASVDNHGFVKSFTEHCTIIGLVSVRADLTYQQGLNRLYSRSTRFDYFWPALAHLGEQAVLNKEIYLQGTATDDNVFGYQERYAEYRYKPSEISGQLRSSHASSLDIWHLSQDFASLPALNNTFIEEAPPIDRVIATPAEPHFVFDGYFNYKCARPIPVYGVPGMIDHF